MVDETLGQDATTEGFSGTKMFVFKNVGENNKSINASYPHPYQVNPLELIPLRESWPVVHTQRVQHALDIYNTAGTFGNMFINTSQSIERMVSGSAEGTIPCITPNGAFFSMPHKRYLTGLGLQTL